MPPPARRNEYSGNEFFDNLSRQDLLELGYTAQHEPEDYYVALLQRGDDLKRLQKQLKKQGDDPHDPLKTNPSESVNGAVGVGAFVVWKFVLKKPPGSPPVRV